MKTMGTAVWVGRIFLLGGLVLPHAWAQDGQPVGADVASETNVPPLSDALLPATNAYDSTTGTVSNTTPVVTAPAPADANVSYFYDALAPYGTWIDVDGTWCWQPSAVRLEPGWWPYCNNGYWIFTDCGWTWYSNYPWGWAPFHYGRWWRHHHHGWIWQPDVVWGPAWVCWRQTAECTGWAPLPPGAVYEFGVGFRFRGARVRADFDFGLTAECFAFVRNENFFRAVLPSCVLPRGEVARIFPATAVAWNGFPVVDNRIVNQGPSAERLAWLLHRQIRPVHVVEHDLRPGEAVRGDVFANNNFSVFRPKLRTEAPLTPPAVIARRQAEEHHRAEVPRAQLPIQGIPGNVPSRNAILSQPAPATRPGVRYEAPVTPNMTVRPNVPQEGMEHGSRPAGSTYQRVVPSPVVRTEPVRAAEAPTPMPFLPHSPPPGAFRSYAVPSAPSSATHADGPRGGSNRDGNTDGVQPDGASQRRGSH